MNINEELLQQTEILAEAIRVAVNENLETVRKLNTAYAHYGDFCERLRKQVEEEANLEPLENLETPPGVTLKPEDLCANCQAYLPEDDTACTVCGEERNIE